MSNAFTLCLTLLIIALSACSSNSNTPREIAVSNDGLEMGTSRNERARTEKLLQTQLGEALGDSWSVGVSLAESPEWNTITEGWEWKTATVAITISGRLTDPLPLPETELAKATLDYLKPRMQRGHEPIVAVTRVEPAFPSTTSGSPSEPRRYTVRSGDTLARISAAYYGRDDAWPAIIAANPEMDPAQLTPGTVLIIPKQP
jgi:nucleoid-associated protein YgaU